MGKFASRLGWLILSLAFVSLLFRRSSGQHDDPITAFFTFSGLSWPFIALLLVLAAVVTSYVGFVLYTARHIQRRLDEASRRKKG